MSLRFDRGKCSLFLRSDLPTGHNGTPTMQQGLDVLQQRIITPIHELLLRLILRLALKAAINHLLDFLKNFPVETEMGSFHVKQTN